MKRCAPRLAIAFFFKFRRQRIALGVPHWTLRRPERTGEPNTEESTQAGAETREDDFQVRLEGLPGLHALGRN